MPTAVKRASHSDSGKVTPIADGQVPQLDVHDTDANQPHDPEAQHRTHPADLPIAPFGQDNAKGHVVDLDGPARSCDLTEDKYPALQSIQERRGV